MTDDIYTLTLAVFDSGEARTKLRGATEVILKLEKKYETAVTDAAEAESYYRLKRAEAFRTHRDAGAAVEAATTLARGECAAEKKAAMQTAGALRLAAERLENARDTRRSLWRLVEWARDKDVASSRGAAQQAFPVNDERAPASRWP